MVCSKKNPTTLMGAIRHFDSETSTRYIEGIKWPCGPCCPECGSINVGRIKSRNRYQCREKGCRKQFSLTTDTIFEATHLRLDQWVVAVWMIVNCRNGFSSCEIARTIGCKQQSAWHLLHRVRALMAQDDSRRMTGIVEADTTLVGGIFKNMPRKRRAKITSRDPRAGKAIVHAVRERKTGIVRAEVIERDTQADTQEVITRHVEVGSRLHTDSATTYKWARRAGYDHETVNHNADEYVRGDVTTNGAENFFNCLRRAAKGTYFRPSHEHLQAYVDEAVFRFNVRHETEWDRFDAAMRRVVGKRLTYSRLTDGAVR